MATRGAPRVIGNLVLFWSGWPSQWHKSRFVVEGIEYCNAEQWMMAEKARLFEDDEVAGLTLAQILACKEPRRQKSLGRKVRNFDPARWHAACRDIVYRGSLFKFRQNPTLLTQLLATAPKVLAEASPNDDVWGIGLAATDPRALDQSKWPGQNLLGQALMRARDTLAAELKTTAAAATAAAAGHAAPHPSGAVTCEDEKSTAADNNHQAGTGAATDGGHKRKAAVGDPHTDASPRKRASRGRRTSATGAAAAAAGAAGAACGASARARVATSASHPLQVGWLRNGTLGMTLAPGKKQKVSHSGLAWDRDLESDIDALASVHRCTVLVSLLEPHEFKALRIEGLFESARRAGITVLHFPIPDRRAPSDSDKCRVLVDRIVELLASGAVVVAHCMGGLGRSGTVAALVLISQGVSAEAAIRTVRAARKGAIQTAAQVKFVKKWVPLGVPSESSASFTLSELPPTAPRKTANACAGAASASTGGGGTSLTSLGDCTGKH